MDRLSVSRELLPPDEVARHSALRNYFCDKDAVAVLEDGRWKLELHWPGGRDRHVDPRLEEGLAWWGGGIRPETMHLARRREGGILWTLFDSWTLHGWSEWMSRAGTGSASPVVLHVDDHRDMMSPRLFRDADGWFDPLAARRLSLDDPGSVASAILSGAIGMGSFMIPMLHRFPDAEVRHLCQPPKATGTLDRLLRTGTEPDGLLSPGAERPALDLVDGGEGVGPGRYRLTTDLDDWLEALPDEPLLLHVDLDYFNKWVRRGRRLGDSWRDARSAARRDAGSRGRTRRSAVAIGRAKSAGGSHGRILAWLLPGRALGTGVAAFGGRGRKAVSGAASKKRRVRKAPARLARRPRAALEPVAESEVALSPAKGTKGRGGGPGGEAWHVEAGGTSAGVVFINWVDQPPIGPHASIQIFINKASQGRGIGRIGYSKACEASSYATIYASMRKSNTASRRAAEGAGFEVEIHPDHAQLIMVWRRLRPGHPPDPPPPPTGT